MTQNILTESVGSMFAADLGQPTEDGIKSRDDLLALFSTGRSLRSLKSAATDGARHLSKIAQRCGILSRKQKVCCLLDWQVLLIYLRMEPLEGNQRNNAESLLMEVFFEHGHMPFAFPLGAFEELLEHLSRKRARPASRQIISSNNDLNTNEAVAQMLSAFSDRPVEHQMTLEEQFSELEARFNDNDFELARLLAVLKNKRFVGVRTHFVSDDVDKWQALQEWKSRDPHKSRNVRRDAINLAIACHDLIHVTITHDRQPLPEGYLLLTETKRMHEFMANLSSSHEMRVYARRAFNGNIEDYPDKFNVVSAKDFAILEWFGDMGSPEGIRRTESKAKDYQNTYAAFEINLDEELESLENQTPQRQHQTLDRFAFARKQRLVEVCQGVIKMRAEMQAVHRQRMLVDAVESTQQRWREPNANAEASEQAVISQEQFWSQVEIVLSEQVGIRCEVNIDWPQSNEPFAGFSIAQTPAALNQLIYGELQYSAKALLPDALQASWPTLCLEDDFAEALRRLFPLTDRACALQLPQPPEDVVLILTDGATYHIDIADLPPDWSWINAKRLRSFLHDKVPAFHSTGAADIESLWIRLSYCSIVYEYIPEIRSYRRMISIRTKYNIGNLVAKLIAQTSPTFYVTGLLSESFRQLMSSLPPLNIL
jgi:hypothetical protein